MGEVYYNEIDPKAAAWLRELIKEGHLPKGIVDERSIEDVKPTDLVGYRQCHFFSGLGGWPAALRIAGWPDDLEIWTGSCPCQPFSAAGKGKGTADERHLWPDFLWLIKQCRPIAIGGEQVASAAGIDWLDIVSTDLEGEDYAVWPVVFPACGIGAPHLRQRLYWFGVADAASCRRQHEPRGQPAGVQPEETGDSITWAESCGYGTGASRVADTDQLSPGAEREQRGGELGRSSEDSSGRDGHPWPGPVNGWWGSSDWLLCRDDKWRPVEPGTFPLADGLPGRVGRLRGYGNAIVLPQAVEYIKAVMDVLGIKADTQR